MTKNGFMNSEGCNKKGPIAIQRVAPLTLVPNPTNVAKISPKKTNNIQGEIFRILVNGDRTIQLKTIIPSQAKST